LLEARTVSNSPTEPGRREALLDAYFFIARSSYRKSPEIFDKACRNLERLRPGCLPSKPWKLRMLSRWIGYRNAEEMAYWYRWSKRFSKKVLRKNERVDGPH
jgi:hypothetical protein